MKKEDEREKGGGRINAVWIPHFLMLLLALIGMGTMSCSAANSPNIVLIVADDMGYSDTGS